MNIDRTMLKLFREDLDTALKPLAEKYGIDLRAGHVSFEPEKRFNIKVEGAAFAGDGTAVRREAEDFKRYAEHFGLKSEHLGQTVSISGRVCKILGLRMNAPKRPILLEDVARKRVVVAAPEAVQFALSRVANG